MSRLADLVRERNLIELTIELQIELDRQAGRTWREIADDLNVTRQAAMQKYGK